MGLALVRKSRIHTFHVSWLVRLRLDSLKNIDFYFYFIIKNTKLKYRSFNFNRTVTNVLISQRI